jgi:hypothetical protein
VETTSNEPSNIPPRQHSKTEGLEKLTEQTATSSYPYYPGRRQSTGQDGWAQSPVHQLRVGNWVAVWDTEYSTWYFHNLVTGASTWQRPAQLEHLNFRNITSAESRAGGALARVTLSPL